jgi:hypothetical protein
MLFYLWLISDSMTLRCILESSNRMCDGRKGVLNHLLTRPFGWRWQLLAAKELGWSVTFHQFREFQFHLRQFNQRVRHNSDCLRPFNLQRVSVSLSASSVSNRWLCKSVSVFFMETPQFALQGCIEPDDAGQLRRVVVNGVAPHQLAA